MAQQFRAVVTLFIDIKFKRKDGMHKTLSKVIYELNDTVPVEVIGVDEPVGKLTMGIGEDSFLVKIMESEVMWSVALLSKI